MLRRFRLVEILVKILFDHLHQNWVKKFINRDVAQFGRALRSGRRGRVFKSRRLDHKPHYKAIYWLCNAVLIFKAVTFCYVLDYRFGTREVCANSKGCPVLGRVFCSAVFFVYCGSIFETLPTESYVGIELFFEMRYAFVSPYIRYSPKHRVPFEKVA